MACLSIAPGHSSFHSINFLLRGKSTIQRQNYCLITSFHSINFLLRGKIVGGRVALGDSYGFHSINFLLRGKKNGTSLDRETAIKFPFY